MLAKATLFTSLILILGHGKGHENGGTNGGNRDGTTAFRRDWGNNFGDVKGRETYFGINITKLGMEKNLDLWTI